MATKNWFVIASLFFALVLPVVILILALLQPSHDWDPPEALMVTGFVTVVILSPLAAAFCGHAARRQTRESGRDLKGGWLALTGLSLGYLELVCVVVLLLGAHPHSNRRGLYEASAVGSLRTVNRAEQAYSEKHTQVGFTKDLRGLFGSDSQSGPDWFIDETLASGTKSHYKFTYVPNSSKQGGPFDRYQLFADPVDKDMRHFFTDQSGVIRYDYKSAKESSPELK